MPSYGQIQFQRWIILTIMHTHYELCIDNIRGVALRRLLYYCHLNFSKQKKFLMPLLISKFH